MYPKQTIEVIPLQDGTFVLRVYTVSAIQVGNISVPEGRALTSMKAYVNLNTMIADLKVVIAAIPV